ncbi:GNAT family N-acetyltransferase [Acerihabitans arboris]|uniref:GNAT family N-acetyltransferase n=1 Tax=Acerihabitans arboris TaxID=2691583 RepID=A0A845SEN3_9GAMM|nr:GNAT family N-acetyltransferase [Acerihabitans arboris]NDL61546.1 GNAT family N-acetyltransferase [Acerihabitans arboris]
MIILRNMAAVEYPDYRLLLIGEYARDLSATHRYDIHRGRENARASIDGSLPLGVDTADHQLYCIEPADADADLGQRPVAGYLWVGRKGDTAFIYDFYILPAWRRRGLGRSALAQLDRLLRGQGVTELGLRVAAGNPGAQVLYDACGFRVTGVNMAKPL